MSAPRLLFVDDDASVSHVLSIWLRRWGYDVITAGSGQEAERLLDERFDALGVPRQPHSSEQDGPGVAEDQ